MINIRFIIIFSVLSVFFSCSNASEPNVAKINGTADFNGQWLYLVKPDPWQIRASIIDSSLIDSDGKFSFSADIPEMQEYLISGRGFFITNVFLENGFDLNVNVKGKGNKGKEVAFDGAGSTINTFWYNFSNKYYAQGGYNDKYKKLVSENEPMAFKEAYTTYASKQFEVLDSFFKAEKPSKYFVEWAESFVEYSSISKNYTYLFHKPRFSKSNGYLNVEDEYYEFLKKVSLKKEPKVVHSAYNDFIYFFIVDHKMRNLSGSTNALLGSIEFAKNELPMPVANRAIAHLLKDQIQVASTRDDYSLLRQQMANLEASENTEKYAEFLAFNFKQKAVLAPGSPAPNFTLRDMDGNDVSIADYKGKVVVIDFWGTWCGPCKRELPFSKKIEEHFANRDDVVFVFVALERGSRKDWMNFVVANDLPGVHLYSSNGEKSLQPYKITSVPRYVLLDKDGNIYDAFASRPSQNMQGQISKALGI
ncbi:MAG: TlpA family protein disulfide reductase [Bacteroidia bacterium]